MIEVEECSSLLGLTLHQHPSLTVRDVCLQYEGFAGMWSPWLCGVQGCGALGSVGYRDVEHLAL